MITQITHGELDYINVSVACVTVVGARIDPQFVTATFFAVSSTDGSLSRAEDIGTDGTVALTRQAGEVGFWGAGVDIRELAAGMYVVLFEITYADSVAVVMDTLQISGGYGGPDITVTSGPNVNEDE